eukprot:scaffold103131_cov21-Tisochrysis_lutea.AAC.1
MATALRHNNSLKVCDVRHLSRGDGWIFVGAGMQHQRLSALIPSCGISGMWRVAYGVWHMACGLWHMWHNLACGM